MRATVDFDDPLWSSLHGVHAGLAQVVGAARRYPPDVATFAAYDRATPSAVADLVELVRRGPVALCGTVGPTPAGLVERFRMAAPRFVFAGAVPDRAPTDVVELGVADYDEMVSLAKRTAPGPFFARTGVLGTYLGVRRAGRLVAMAGERMRPTGGTEISAVCTDADARGQGLGSMLTLELVRRILARDELPFLHTAPDNVTAQRLYGSLGFVEDGATDFVVVDV